MWQIELEFISGGRDIEDVIVEIMNEYEVGAVVTHSGLTGAYDYRVRLTGTWQSLADYVMREYAYDSEEYAHIMGAKLRRTA